MLLADGIVLQVDQANLAHQTLFRQERQRGQRGQDEVWIAICVYVLGGGDRAQGILDWSCVCPNYFTDSVREHF